MKCILPEGRDQLATKQDLEVVDARLRAEFGELRGEFGELRGEFGELRGFIDSALAKHTRTHLMALLGFAVTMWVSLLVASIF